jgi:hypothetical protein
MSAARKAVPLQAKLDALRTEFADLAFDLERQGRRDAADVVMVLDTRVREMAQEIAAEEAATGTSLAQPAGIVRFSSP